jgi:hypothetical protein
MTGKRTGNDDTDGRPSRRKWDPPRLTPVGHVGNVLQGGEGKITTMTGDPGDPKKPSGQK